MDGWMWDEATTVISSGSRPRRQDFGSFAVSKLHFRECFNLTNPYTDIHHHHHQMRAYGTLRYALSLTVLFLHCPRVFPECIQPTLTASNRAVCSQTSSSNELPP
jgi:hypothetical protein